MYNILIIGQGSRCSWNKGAAAITISAIGAIKMTIPNSSFTLISPPHHFEMDSKRCPKYVKVVKSFDGGIFSQILTLVSYLSIACICIAIYRLFKLKPNFLIKNEVLQEYNRADIIIDLSGEGITDNFSYLWNIFTSVWILIGYIMRKPVVVYAHSVGPFKKKLNLFLARLIYNRVKLLITREELSKKQLQLAGINRQVYYTADSAFCLEPISSKNAEKILLNEGYYISDIYPIVGVSLSQATANVLTATYNEYIQKIAKLTDYLIEELIVDVIFVPHVIYPKNELDDDFKNKMEDDRVVAKEVYQKIKYQNRVVLISNEYTPEQLKGVIGVCDMFIGSRMHANIAALSMCVPTVGIAYSNRFHKYYGIFRMMGQEKYVCDVKNMTFDELKLKVNEVWSNRKEIKKELEHKSEIARKLAFYNAKLVKNIMDSPKNKNITQVINHNFRLSNNAKSSKNGDKFPY